MDEKFGANCIHEGRSFICEPCVDAEIERLTNRIAALEAARQDAADLGHEKIVRLEAQLAEAQEIIERIMTMHWDMITCQCWICNDGRKLGFGPKDKYLEHKNGYRYAHIPIPAAALEVQDEGA